MARDPFKESWYHGRVSRLEAERILEKGGLSEGLYLLRDSLSTTGDFVLSVCHRREVYHYQLSRRQDKIAIENGKKFEGPVELVQYHQHNLDGLMTKLLKPCVRGIGKEPKGYRFISQVELRKAMETAASQLGYGPQQIQDAISFRRAAFEQLVGGILHRTQKWFHGNITREESEARIKCEMRDASTVVHAAEKCRFSIPSTANPGECDTYDLTPQAVQGPYQFKGTDRNNKPATFYFSLCGNVPNNSLPSSCAGLEPSPGYMVLNGSENCVRLGDLNTAMGLPVCPMNSQAGVRVVYSNGDKGDRFNWAIIHDFKCDIVGDTPQVIFENPENTIKVIWRWPKGTKCVYDSGEGTCPQYNYGTTYDTQRFRPRPMWFENAKFGIFIHWGIFSVPAYKNEWYWRRLMQGQEDYVTFHNRVYGCSGVDPEKYPCNGAKFTYYDFPPMFHAEMFDPDHWASVFSKAGAKYVVLTSKHHEGWCNFDSSYHWNWNSVSLGPKRDLVMNLTSSVKKSGLIMGLYHSLREWYQPLYMEDEYNNCTADFPGKICNPTMIEMIAKYEPWLLWNDGAGDNKCQHNYLYWKAEALRDWMYNESPVKNNIVVNTRCGTGCIGDYQEGGDRFAATEVLPYTWESGYTIQAHSWGYDRTDDPFLSVYNIIHMLVLTVSRNGNLLLNVGPTADGRLDPLFEERLLDIGAWMDINSEAIYSTIPWRVQNDTVDELTWFTANKDGVTVYAITFESITPGGKLSFLSPRTGSNTSVSMFGYSGEIDWSSHSTPTGLTMAIPTDLNRKTFANMPAVVFKLVNVT